MLGYTPFIKIYFDVSERYLLALMTILAKSLLTLVSSHLVALLLLSVRHNFLNLIVIYCNVLINISPFSPGSSCRA